MFCLWNLLRLFERTPLAMQIYYPERLVGIVESKWLRLKETIGDHLVQHCFSNRTIYIWEFSRFWISFSKEEDATTFFSNPCQLLIILTAKKKCLLLFRGILKCFSSCPLTFVLSLGTLKRAYLQLFLHPAFRYLYTFRRFIFIRLKSPSFLTLSSLKRCSTHCCGFFLDSFQ